MLSQLLDGTSDERNGLSPCLEIAASATELVPFSDMEDPDFCAEQRRQIDGCLEGSLCRLGLGVREEEPVVASAPRSLTSLIRYLVSEKRSRLGGEAAAVGWQRWHARGAVS
jgi:hypothetical protein